MLERLQKFLSARGVDFATFGAVFDIGSRDGRQSIELSNLFPQADVVAIECNPATLDQCRANIAQHPRIKLIEKAVNSHTGSCRFFPIDPLQTVTTWEDGNPGASSLFVATGDYPAEQYVQNEIDVDCTRLDDLCKQLKIDTIDLIWMDLQGAELLALESAGDLLDKVRYIYTEVSHRSIYEGQCLFDDVDAFLVARGFRRCTKIDRDRWQQDLIYENTRDFIDVVIPLGSGDPVTAKYTVRSIRKFVQNVRNIYVVSAENPDIDGVYFIDQTRLPFDVHAIAPDYLRQLIKLYFPLMVPTSLEHVLAVDADTIFLRNCQFVAGGQPIFSFGGDHRAPVLEHMTRLCPDLRPMMAYSGIAHCMIFHRAWLKDLHEKVEAHHRNLAFWQAYLQTIDPEKKQQGASDGEIYFSYCLTFHPQDLILRQLRWAPAGDIGEIPQDRPNYIFLDHRLRTAPLDQDRLENLLAS